MAEYGSAAPIEEDDRATRDRLLLDAGVGAWRFDPDTDLYTFAKELMRNFAGMSPSVPRAMVEAICHPDDLVIERPLRERITTKGGSGELELRMRLPGGAAWKHQRIILRSGRQLPSGRFEMYGLTLDVTESAAARNEARARNEQLDLALRAAQGGVFSIDFQRGVFLSSPEFVDIAGADIARGEGLQGIWPMIHPDDVPKMQAMAGHWGEPGRTSVDVRTTARQGDPWIRVYCDVVRDRDGAAQRGVGLVLDIDDLKRQELALDAARQEALAATAAKSAFLASVSHEIRTPMNGIVGVLHLLKSESLSASGAAMLDEGLGCAEMLGQLINDLLDFSKIEAGKLAIAPEPLDLPRLVRGVVDLLRPQAVAKGIWLRAQLDPSLAWVEADPVRLRQCLFNLIGNAVKFTLEGGVTVDVDRDADGRLRLAVADTGVGIPQEAQARLFQRFEQASVATTKRFSGTGLGLAITRALGRQMGGDVSFQSVEGEGSTFTLQMTAPSIAAREVTSLADEGSLERLRVLVVDDNRTNRLIAQKILEALGAQAVTAEDGATAVSLAAAERFDAILMDVNMPGMDGLETLRRIRALDPRITTPVIALTADVEPERRAQYLAAGMDGVIAKPFSPAELAAEVSLVLQTRQAGRSSGAVA